MKLPRFKMESSFALREVLSKLGMPLAFSTEADFSGMASGKGELYISEVFHKVIAWFVFFRKPIDLFSVP